MRDYFEWHVVESDRELLLRGMEEREQWQLSFWDGLILAAARCAASKPIWSEDLNTGHDYGGIRVVNPLKVGKAS